MLRPAKSPSRTPNRRWAAWFARKIMLSGSIIRMATGLLSIRNSNCSSAARRAAASLFHPPQIFRFPPAAAADLVCEQAGAGKDAEHQDVLRQRDRQLKGNGSNRSASSVHTKAVKRICHRQHTVPPAAWEKGTGNQKKCEVHPPVQHCDAGNQDRCAQQHDPRSSLAK